MISHCSGIRPTATRRTAEVHLVVYTYYVHIRSRCETFFFALHRQEHSVSKPSAFSRETRVLLGRLDCCFEVVKRVRVRALNSDRALSYGDAFKYTKPQSSGPLKRVRIVMTIPMRSSFLYGIAVVTIVVARTFDRVAVGNRGRSQHTGCCMNITVNTHNTRGTPARRPASPCCSSRFDKQECLKYSLDTFLRTREMAVTREYIIIVCFYFGVNCVNTSLSITWLGKFDRISLSRSIRTSVNQAKIFKKLLRNWIGNSRNITTRLTRKSKFNFRHRCLKKKY